MRRFLALFALFGVFSSQLAYASFSDVTPDTPYSKSIEWMQDNGVVSGNSKGLFEPNECVTRAEMLRFLYNSEASASEAVYSGSSSFSDVYPSHWAYNYIRAAENDELVNGFGDGTFRPDKCMSRAEGITLAMTYFLGAETYREYLPFSINTNYVDVTEEDWFYEAVAYAIDYNLVGLEHMQDSAFAPKGDFSRAEVSEMIYRFKTAEDNGILFYSEWYTPYALPSNQFHQACATPANHMLSQVRAEEAAPASSEVVLSINQSNQEQLKNLNGLFGQWGGMGMSELMGSGMNMQWMAPFLKGNWEGSFALNFPENFDWSQDLQEVDSNEVDFYLSITTKDGEALMDALAPEFQKMMPTIYCSTENNTLYWTSGIDDFFMAHTGNFFFVTNTEANREAGLERLRSQTGFQGSTHDNLFHFSVNLEHLSQFLAQKYRAMDLNFAADSLEDLSQLEATLQAEEEGLRFTSKTDFRDDESRILLPYRKAELSMSQRLAGENLVMYLEEQDLSLLFESMSEGLSPVTTPAAIAAGMAKKLSPSYEILLDQLTQNLSLNANELSRLLNASYALTVADVEGLLPGIAFYVDVDSSDRILAGRFSKDLDKMIEDLVASEALGSLVWEEVEGTNLRRVTFSSALIDPSLALGDLELTYGLTQENDYVFALYPDFAETYTSLETVSHNDRFQTAMKKVQEDPASVAYLDVAGLMTMLEEGFNQMGDEFSKASFAEFKPALAPFEFMIGVKTAKKDSIFSDAYIGR